MKTLEQIKAAAAELVNSIENGTISAAQAEKKMNVLNNDLDASNKAQERKTQAAKDAANKYDADKAAAKDTDKAAKDAAKDAAKLRKDADKAANKAANEKDAAAKAAVAKVAEKNAAKLRKDADKAANKAANAKTSKERTAQAAKDAKAFAKDAKAAVAPVAKAFAALVKLEKAAADKAAKEKAAKDAAARKDAAKAQAEYDAAAKAAQDADKAAKDANDANKAAKENKENARYNWAYANAANGKATAQDAVILSVHDANANAAAFRNELYNVYCELVKNPLFKEFKAEFGTISQATKYLRNNYAAVAPIFNVFGVGLEKNDLQPRIFTANWAQDAAKYAADKAAKAAAQGATDADKAAADKAAKDAAKAEKYALSPYLLMPTKNGIRVALVGKKAAHVINTWNAPTALIILVINAAARRLSEKDAAAKDAAALQFALLNAAQDAYNAAKDANDAADKAQDANGIITDAAAVAELEKAQANAQDADKAARLLSENAAAVIGNVATETRKKLEQIMNADKAQDAAAVAPDAKAQDAA